MKKLLIAPLLALVFFVGARVPVHAAAPNWDVTDSWVSVFTLGADYAHDMILSQDGAGNVTGSGGYIAGGPYSYTWNVTSGSVDGDTITLTILYDVGAPGTVMHMTGTIAPDGSMSGVWDDNFGGYRAGTWHTSSGAAVSLTVDTDGDGVVDYIDKCAGTVADGGWDESWGQNRFEVRNVAGDLVWYQNKVKKGVAVPTAAYDISYTYGCNGHQILAMLEAELGSVMNGHHKFGLSAGLLKDFHDDLADGVLDGKYFLESVAVPATDLDGVASLTTLLSGHDYTFRASGTAHAGDGIEFDADYSYRTPTSVTWTDAVSTYEGLGDSLLDLQVNGSTVGWDNDAVYNVNHVYYYDMAGLDAPVTFKVNDVYYPNNAGSLVVDIYAQI